MNQIENANCDMRQRHLFYLVEYRERKLLAFCAAAPGTGRSHWQSPPALPPPSLPLMSSSSLFQAMSQYYATPTSFSSTSELFREEEDKNLGEGMELCSFLCAKFSHHSTLESREGLGLNYQALQLSSCLAFRKLLNPSGFMLLITYYFIYIHNTAVIACWFIHLTNHMPLCCSPPIPCPLPAVSVGQGMSP